MEGTIKQGQRFYVEPTKTFKHNDIVVFDYLGEDYGLPPDDMGKYQLKEQKRTYRLIAMSGDILDIRRGEVYVNNVHSPRPSLAKTDYEIDSRVTLDEFADKDPDLVSFTRDGDTLKYITALTQEEADRYALNKTAIFAIKKIIQEAKAYDRFYTRASSSGTWSTDNYGPLKIPGPGDSILVNEINFSLYHNIPGIHTGLNFLKEKLYFVMGDNRHRAQDSRFIGFISQSKMYGVVVQ
jgi:signal peptidase I